MDKIKIINYFLNVIPNWFYLIQEKKTKISFEIKSDFLNHLVFFLKFHTNTDINILTDIFAVDNPKTSFRFSVYYELISIFYNYRLEIICNLYNSNKAIISLMNFFSSANWLEREVWDLFGIFFFEHSDLRRILTDYGFRGFPLRKDFPLTGYEELRYDDGKKRIVYEPIQISQEFRFFEFNSPWVTKLFKLISYT